MVHQKEKELVIKLLKKYQLSINKENIDILKETCSKEFKNIKFNKIDILALLSVLFSFINTFVPKSNQLAIFIIVLGIYLIYIILKAYILLVKDNNYDVLEDILNELLLEHNIKREKTIFQRFLKIFIS